MGKEVRRDDEGPITAGSGYAIARDGLSPEAAAQRMAAQWPIARKVEAADEVVMTDGTFEDTDAQVDALIGRLQARARASHPTR